MKKLALALLSASALVFGLGAVADAQNVPYDDNSQNYVVSLSTPTVGGGSSVQLDVSGCTPSEGLTLALDGTDIANETCAGSSALGGSLVGLLLPAQAVSGSASFVFDAPSAAGSYTLTVTGDQGFSSSTVLTVSAAAAPAAAASGAAPAQAGLPATGSDGISTTVQIAAGLFAVGLGLLVVAQLRRRRTASLA